MSNHYHLVITDTKGRLPDFQRDLNSTLARSIHAFRGRWEGFWDRDSYSAVALLEDGDRLAKMAYTLANPVEARLVNRAWQWEGASSAGVEFGRGRRMRRPEGFFGETMPETAMLEVTLPVCEGVEGRSFEELLGQEVERRELAARERGSAMGMRRVMAQDWRESPESREPRRVLRPTVAGRNKWARIAALQRSAVWLGEYAVARMEFLRGNREVVFPRGTWWMCARLGCCVGG